MLQLHRNSAQLSSCRQTDVVTLCVSCGCVCARGDRSILDIADLGREGGMLNCPDCPLKMSLGKRHQPAFELIGACNILY